MSAQPSHNQYPGDTVMDRTERFYKIELLIRARGAVSFATLMEELEVSRATLKRDLDYLRTRMSAPIVYDRERNGYRLDPQSGGSAKGQGAAHELPGVWFSEREIHALLSMHQLINGLDISGTLGRHLQPMLDKLHGMLGANNPTEALELMKRVRIVHPALRPVEGKVFERVSSALMSRRRLVLVHHARSTQTDSERSVSPQRLTHYRNTWYLDAWCHTHDGLRRFALDAVRSATVEALRAKDVSLRTVEAELDSGYGIYGGKSVHTATLRFSPQAARWVASEQWHPRQELRLQPDGSLVMKLPYADDTELIMDLMRHGSEVRVEAPADLRDKLAARLREAAAQYAG